MKKILYYHHSASLFIVALSLMAGAMMSVFVSESNNLLETIHTFVVGAVGFLMIINLYMFYKISQEQNETIIQFNVKNEPE